MKLLAIALIAATANLAAIGGVSAYSSSSKSSARTAEICRDKLALKHLKGNAYKDERVKCMNDPTGYN